MKIQTPCSRAGTGRRPIQRPTRNMASVPKSRYTRLISQMANAVPPTLGRSL
jgi:hypothetical protein